MLNYDRKVHFHLPDLCDIVLFISRIRRIFLQSVRVRATENAATEDDENGPGAETASIASVAEIVNVTGNAIAREKETAIGTGSVITANHIRESDHAAEKESANVREIVNIENEAEKKGKPNDLT